MTTTQYPVRVLNVRAEYRTDSPVVATATPQISWQSATETAGWRQASAELELIADDERLVASVDGGDSVLVSWPFPPLEPGATRQLRVRVTGVDGSVSPWSDSVPLLAGFLPDGGWTGRMIGLTEPERPAQPALVRTTFSVAGRVRRATLFATARGVYQAEVNGAPVDDEILKPGWTSYQFRLIHETTDVTSLLTEGRNTIGAWIAGGWYTESFGFRDSAKPFYGEQPAVALQLVIDYEDGQTDTISSGTSWKAVPGPIISSGIYAGESFDATLVAGNWGDSEFDDSAWTPVRVDEDFPEPSPRSAPAVRAIEQRSVERVITSPSGKTILDFGQNLVGRLRITVRGERGHTVTLRHAEVLEHGELGIRPLRRAAAVDRYTLAGSGDEQWEPRFTFHGFRYAQVDNWPGTLDPEDIVAVVIHSDMERTGWFDSSNELVNRFHENVVWGMRGNFLYLPTDCPQRDERLGWTGDIQVFSPTASYLFDSDGFLSAWLEDLALEQHAADGIVPFIVPNVLGDWTEPAAAWGDAACVVPWVLYERFGNLRVLADQYESMKSWVETVAAISGDRLLWEGRFQFGDWLDPDAPADYPADAKTDPDIVASAYFFRSTDILARTAALLGLVDDAERYAELAARIKTAFLSEYVTLAGRMMSDAQTSYGLAIMFGLTRDDGERARMGDRLAELVRSAGYRIGTGFVGTPLVADALTVTGHLETASRLLTQTENPSWLYSVTMGATTVWERWDSMLEDGSINPGEMTSFNHYALGAIADWLHRTVAGLAPAAPGYRAITIHPHPLPGFDYATTAHETPYGLASAGWTRNPDGTVTVEAIIPANTTATVYLPGATTPLDIGSGSHSWTVNTPHQLRSHADLSLQSPLSTVIDDPEAYEAVWNTIATHDTEVAREYRRHTEWVSGRTLADSLLQLTPDIHSAVEATLVKLNQTRAGALPTTAP